MKSKAYALFKLAQQHPIPTAMVATVALTTAGYMAHATGNREIAIDRDGVAVRHPQDATIRTGKVTSEEGSNRISANGPRASIFTEDVKAKRDNDITVNGHNPRAVPSNPQPPRP